MVPYIHPTSLVIVPGVIEFHTFGLLVGIAVVVGSLVAQRRAESVGLSARVTADAAIWMVVIGFIFAHWVSVIFYFPERMFGTVCTADHQCGLHGYYGIHFGALANADMNPGWLESIVQGIGKALSFVDSAPEAYICQENGRCNDGSGWSLALLWAGISSIGGFLGAFIAILIFFNVKKITLIPKLLVLDAGKGRPTLKYLDAFAYGMAFAWIFGRMACYTAHDHIGKLTNSFLGMRFPKEDWDGIGPHERDILTPEAAEMFANVDYIQRFDLGFLEMLWAIAISAFFFFWARKRTDLRPGWYVTVMLVTYGPYRVFLDSLRATDISGADPRYLLNMTAAQIGAVVMVGLGLWVWWLGGRAMKKEGYMDNSAFEEETDPNEAKASS